jgi:hypothetical protein
VESKEESDEQATAGSRSENGSEDEVEHGAPSTCERDGQPARHRLNRGGNRQLNALIHRVAMIQVRCQRPARAIYEATQQRGHNRKAAMGS